MITALLVLVLGGGAGVARYLVDSAVQARWPGAFPLGTFVVNVGGCFALGLLTGLDTSARVTLIVGTATIGSYTTFSTWMLETQRPAEDGETGLAWRNIVFSLVVGFAFALAGKALGSAL